MNTDKHGYYLNEGAVHELPIKEVKI